MEVLGAVVQAIPNVIAVFAYPWLVKPKLVEYVGGLPSAQFICEKLVASFQSVPATLALDTEVPEEAFALTVQELLTRSGFPLSVQQLAPLLVRLGQKGLADPDLQEPTS